MQPLVVRNAANEVVSITVLRPSNMHQHYRPHDTPMFNAIAPVNMRHIKYGLSMPNNGITGPTSFLRTPQEAIRHYHSVMDMRARHKISTFSDLVVTVYHSAAVDERMLEYIGGLLAPKMAIKEYPTAHGATTNSGHGVSFCDRPEIAKAAARNKVRQLFHAEDVFDKNGNTIPHPLREAHAITNRMWKYRDQNPDALICIEHASTIEAVEFVKADPSGRTVMTVTPQHAFCTCDDFNRSWANHLKCMPIVKTEENRQAVVDFATSGDPRVIMGDDTAGHLKATKERPFDECASGCWLPHSSAIYARVFLDAGAMDERFTKFMSLNGPAWWGLTPPSHDDLLTIRTETVHDIPDPTPVPEHNDVIVPLGWTTEPDRLKIGYAV